MENLSYARKYRPSTLDDYIGNDGLKESVSSLEREDGWRPRSLLLTGPTGCGKTTIARIIAKDYLCSERVDGRACGVCSMCERMDEYILTGNTDNIPDIEEVDITKDGGKDAIEAVLNEAEYPPYEAEYKIYILDEVHMATQAAQNAMLKSIEEPVDTTVFILATTDPQRVLPTLLNRANWKYAVEKPKLKELSELLAKVCIREGVKYDPQGVRAIATRSNFIIRESLQLLEQVVTSRGSAEIANVSEEFAEVTDHQIFTFFTCHQEKDHVGYMGLMSVIKSTVGFPIFLNSLRTFCARAIYAVNGVEVEGLSVEEVGTYRKLFKEYSQEDIAYILEALRNMDKGDTELNLMTFIYTNGVQNVKKLDMKETTKVEEAAERSSYIKSTEESAKQKAVKRIESSELLDNVSPDKLQALLNLRKVEKNG